LPWDDALDAELGDGPRADLTEDFDVNYLRIMENSTDIFHVPFVHRYTVPVGEVLEDYECDVDGVHIRVRGRLTRGDGDDGLPIAMHVVAPSLLLLEVSAKARFVAVVTPIDEERTWLFVRYVQDYVRVPGIGRLLAWMLGKFDYVLLQRHQDAPVWRSQRLERPDDIRHYHLLEGDRGVAAYFRIHQRLLHDAESADERRHHDPGPRRDPVHRAEPATADRDG